MSFLLTIALIAGADLYFLKDSPDLLVRVVPKTEIRQLTLHYSFSGTNWDSMVVIQEGRFFDATLKSPDSLKVIGFYCVYDNGFIDDKDGEPYLYELSIFPRMLMPFSFTDIEVILNRAMKKIEAGKHIDEAITLLDYADRILAVVPVLQNSPQELKRNTLQIESGKLRSQIVR